MGYIGMNHGHFQATCTLQQQQKKTEVLCSCVSSMIAHLFVDSGLTSVWEKQC